MEVIRNSDTGTQTDPCIELRYAQLIVINQNQPDHTNLDQTKPNLTKPNKL